MVANSDTEREVVYDIHLFVSGKCILSLVAEKRGAYSVQICSREIRDILDWLGTPCMDKEEELCHPTHPRRLHTIILPALTPDEPRSHTIEPNFH